MFQCSPDIEIIPHINKSPNQRSKKKLERIKVKDVDDFTLNNTVKKQDKKIEEKAKIDNVQESDMLEECSNENFYESPKNAIQFYHKWNILNEDQKLNYLKFINPASLKDVFQESLDSKVFSEIIKILDKDRDKNISIYDYLLGLAEVKRFRALVMFMSSKEKNGKYN